MMNDDDMLTNLDNALDQLEEWQKMVLFLDVENDFKARNEILYREVGVSTQGEINRYINRLKAKVKELVETGEYMEKHKGNSKPTLKGF